MDEDEVPLNSYKETTLMLFIVFAKPVYEKTFVDGPLGRLI